MSIVKTHKKTQGILGIIAGCLFLTGCGGGGDEEPSVVVVEQPEDTIVVVETDTPDPEIQPEQIVENDAPDLSATLTGRVVDISGSPLSGVAVAVTVPGIEDQAIASTDENGAYLINTAPGSASSASFALAGYKTEQYNAINLEADNTKNLGTIRLVSVDNAGEGTLTGTISNAVNGDGVEGLTLRFRQGINVTTGDVVATTTTDANGEYTVNNLPYGNLTCEIIGVGFNTSYANVIALGNIVQSDQNTAVSPNLNTGEIRIVLTWGSTPSDLDSHLTGPQENSSAPFHVYYSEKFSDLVNLDVDETTSFGPETVTIERQINGVYRYTVNNYTYNNDTELSASGARVQVFGEGGLIRDYQVPNGLGDLWVVFEMEGGTITTLNTITYEGDDSEYYPAGLQPKNMALKPSK